ncbi:MAG: penicillin-binding protein activator [Deltaproteobacteria bacterium]|nr:penicillin-binding protein activator [Deltaproteobacteria bacterium]
MLVAFLSVAGCRKAPTVIPPKPPGTVEPALPSEGISSPDAQRLFQSAESDFQAGSLVQALRKFQAFAVRFPGDPLTDDAFLRIGQIYMARNDPYLASLALERIPQDFPGSNRLSDTYPLLAQVYELLGRPDEAVSALRKQMEFSGTRLERGRIYRKLAGLLLKQGNTIRALEALEKSWSLAETPSLKAQIQAEGEALIEGVQEEKTLHHIARSFAGSFTGQLANLKLGELYRSRHQFARARKELQGILATPVVPEYGERAKSILDKILEYTSVDRLALGCIVPLSGEHGEYGRRLVQGIELASRPFLSQENPPDIKLIFRDSRGEPQSAREAVRYLARERKVIGIIGPLVGKAAMAAADEAQRLEVPIVTLTPRDNIPSIGNYVFRNFLTSAHQIRFLVSYVMETLGLQRFAILYPDDQYGKKYMNLFWDEVESRKGSIASAESYSREQTDFSTQIKKLVGIYYTESREPVIDFQAMLIPDTDYKAGLIAPQLAYFDVVGIYLLGTSLWNTPMLVQMAGPFLEKALFVDGFFPQSSLPQVQEFMAQYRAQYGDAPDVWAAHAYDTAGILMELLITHNVSSRAELRDKIGQIRDYPGVTGSTSFTSAGEVLKVPFILTVQDNRIVEVGYSTREERNDVIDVPLISSLPGDIHSDGIYPSDPYDPQQRR